MSEVGAQTSEILKLIQQGLSYGVIAGRFEITRQRVQQIRKRAEEQGVTLNDQRKAGRPKGSGPISSSLQKAIDLLRKYPDATYEQLCSKHNVTRSQLASAHQRATAEGINLKSGKERQGESLYRRMFSDLGNAKMSLPEIAKKYSTSRYYVSQCVARARAAGEEIPYRREPLQPSRVRKAVEEAVKNDRCFSVDEIAQQHKVSPDYVRGVIGRLRQAGEKVPSREHWKGWAGHSSSSKPKPANK
jgi:transposase